MNEKLKFLWINLTQFIVYYDRPNVCNTVVAIGHEEKNVIVIRPEYRHEEQEIVATIRYICMMPASMEESEKRKKPYILYGDGFHIDTWDKQIAGFNKPIHKSPVPTEEDRFIMEYVCNICGEEWEMAGDCACNDHCPGCDAEITPTKVRDIE